MFQSRVVQISTIALLTVFIGSFYAYSNLSTPTVPEAEALLNNLEAPSKAARNAFVFNMLRDPATNAIPPAIRSRELKYIDNVYQDARASSKRQAFNWFSAGPFDVGGRTRAFAIDKTNPNRILAGGVSGGLWESVNQGGSWRPVNVDAGNLSVTYIAQDPRPGQTDVWYYSSGEFLGNSASDASRVAPYLGSGMFKSTDGGDSWFILPAGQAGDETSFDSPFDFVNRIAISPVTGSVFIASNAVGIYRSGDQGDSFGNIPAGQQFPDPVLGGLNQHFWSDVAVNDNGLVLATLSSSSSESRTDNAPGVYISADDGLSWTNITPATFPNNHGRSIVAFVPSNQDEAYIFTTTQNFFEEQEDVRLHRINVVTGASVNLSGNLPQLSEAGRIETQGGYNMALAIKPDDENFVLLGGTNVYRSRNGFSSSIVERIDYWIGGYDAVDDDFGNYENHHPDQHLFVFDPTDPNKMWSANDGGVYMTNDISRSNEVVWFEQNQGYNTSQFYTVAVPPDANDPRIAGGTQDNGTPFIMLNDIENTSRNISVGDGAHLYFGETYAFVGFQNGATLRLQYNDDEAPTFAGFSFIQPSEASNQLFVNPFAVDPNDEEVMYYPAGTSLWRHNTLSDIRSGQTNNEGIEDGWSRLNNIPRLGALTISAMAISTAPSHILYFGGSDTRSNNPGTPRLYRLANATNNDGSGTQTINIPGAVAGAYISDIAVNPEDADELLVVLSNYEITGLYHSLNGGQSFTAVEGNLAGSGALPGPSLRAASILPTSTGTQYFIGTSTGLFQTSTLNGAGTIWQPEGDEVIGKAVVWDVTSRTSDELVAVGTHGRGLFVGSQDPDFNPRPTPESFSLSQNYPNPFASNTRIAYSLSTQARVSVAVFDLSGRKVSDLVTNELKETGRHEVVFNAASLASGVYMFQLLVNPVTGTESASSFSQTRKMMVVK
ncbi:MAG: T9SS type A sorting domain-containing protein [Rhodothermales bacterium]